MSVLIPGMEMPTSPVLFCIHPDGKVFADLEGGWREYKAVPVPPHGDLIDRKAIDWAFTDLRFNSDGTLAHWDDRPNWWVKGSDIERMIQAAPTIIPADAEKEGEG